jgi:hypothetical protein
VECEAARICGVSHRTIQRLVEAGLLKREQVTPRAPWEIRCSDLDAEPIRSVIERLHHTGKLILQGAQMLSPHLLELLRNWWLVLRPKGYLFPGQDRINPPVHPLAQSRVTLSLKSCFFGFRTCRSYASEI